MDARYFTSYPQQSLWKKAASWATLPLARAINFLFGVERKADIYKGYFATGCEKVSITGLHPFMRHLLRTKGRFNLNNTYLLQLSKAEAGKNGQTIKQRYIFVRGHELKQAGIQRAPSASAKSFLLSKRQIDVPAFGQLLAPLAPLTPWSAGNIRTYAPHAEKLKALKSLVETSSARKTKFEMRFQNRP